MPDMELAVPENATLVFPACAPLQKADCEDAPDLKNPLQWPTTTPDASPNTSPRLGPAAALAPGPYLPYPPAVPPLCSAAVPVWADHQLMSTTDEEMANDSDSSVLIPPVLAAVAPVPQPFVPTSSMPVPPDMVSSCVPMYPHMMPVTSPPVLLPIAIPGATAPCPAISLCAPIPPGPLQTPPSGQNPVVPVPMMIPTSPSAGWPLHNPVASQPQCLAAMKSNSVLSYPHASSNSVPPAAPPGTFTVQPQNSFNNQQTRVGGRKKMQEGVADDANCSQKGPSAARQRNSTRTAIGNTGFSIGSDVLTSTRAPAIQYGPPFGTRHRFHDETATMGLVSSDLRQFTKTEFEGRLSLVTENEIHTRGVVKYCLQFSEGELSCADGLGFVFSQMLPCPKNIQKIVSIFVNRAGRICFRSRNEVKRSEINVKRLDLGDWVGVCMDLEEQIATFTVWPKAEGQPSSACFAFGHILARINETAAKPIRAAGHFACVIKNEGVTVQLGS